MINYRVNLGFAGYSDANLNEFTNSVILCLTGNSSFRTPPTTIANLTTLQETFSAALAAAAQGGTQLTAAKKAVRPPLVTALRNIAAYVQSIAGQDAALLLTSGFQINSTSRKSLQLDTPNITQVVNGISTQLLMSLQGVTNARAYEVQTKTGTDNWLAAGIYTYSRNVILAGLTPGVTYAVQTRAIGGSTGYSGWSNPVSCMST